jgi:predicted nucleotide-binding protein
MNTNIPLEVKRALEPIRIRYQDIVSIVESEYYHVVSNDYPNFYFKILKRELSTDNKPFYRAKLAPADGISVSEKSRAIPVADLSDTFENWIKLIIEHKKYDSDAEKLNAINAENNRMNTNKKYDNEVEKLDTNSKANMNKKVFIVHGRCHAFKSEVARFVEKELGIETIILEEKANSGNLIIEKILKHSDDVDYAIVLYTGCDELYYIDKQGKTVNIKRARQNVIFEHGLLIGKLGKEKVCMLLANEDIDFPTDVLGIAYYPYANWKDNLRKELSAAKLI